MFPCHVKSMHFKTPDIMKKNSRKITIYSQGTANKLCKPRLRKPFPGELRAAKSGYN